MSWWRENRRYKSYGVLYLAFHGTKKGLVVGDDPVGLKELAGLVGEIPDTVVHLGSCSVLRADEQAAHQFLRTTKASHLTGYDRDIEWLESAALDMAWLGYLGQYKRVGDAVRRFEERFASTIDFLQWRRVSR